jgi:hypothetical protein
MRARNGERLRDRHEGMKNRETGEKREKEENENGEVGEKEETKWEGKIKVK